jgi:hypothetical protein
VRDIGVERGVSPIGAATVRERLSSGLGSKTLPDGRGSAWRTATQGFSQLAETCVDVSTFKSRTRRHPPHNRARYIL